MSNERLYDLVARVLELPRERVTDDLSREGAETWDSFNHLLLISAVESEMGVTLTTSEIARIKTIGDLNRVIVHRGSRTR